ncbi:unnamed protein product [Notodromas monacha]|uniref:Protein zer-1 homolog-like C-terminal domain-containing protein n=1 Tax=Notodromas monacha TaxID=399045 RepID=A0A7R9C2Q1_9CRUS|nr:unnamed protein product [Notodromas monacha]CAG0924678.1 unnamed protein product [Notodromas monacha]
MQRLLRIVEETMNTSPVDMMLKFTLSALWNLTDESPSTCESFIKAGGLLLFIKILNKPDCDSTVKTKILGLVNNIAEVSPLRRNLMDKSLIDRLRELMKTDLIEVSYFAAGVLAHMTTDGEEPWSVDGVAHTDVLKDLEIVGEWAMPDAEMVAYRTFQPFFPLLRTTSPHAVQLWALWAMLHVCKWNRLWVTHF